MPENRSLPYGAVLPADFLEALQQFIGTGAYNFRLQVLGTTAVRVNAGSGDNQVGLGISGLWRYITAPADTAVSGVAGTYDICAVCSPNAFVGVPEVDNTNYAFTLAAPLAGAAPTVPTGGAYRKVAQVDWNGAAITALRPLIGDAPVDGLPGTPSSRTLGQGAQQAAPGNDARFGNSRAPAGTAGGALSGSYPSPGLVPIANTDVDGAAAIAESKLALASDAAAGTASRRTLGAGTQQACGGADARLAGMPIGTQVAYAGSGDATNGSGTWVIADGRLIDRTTYATYFAAAGHAYNANVDPGSNKVRVPDKRGKKPIGAINMGSAAGAGANDNGHHQAARGTSYGEVNHTTLATELPAHAHSIYDPGHAHTTAIGDPTHAHGVADPNHAHTMETGGTGNVAAGGAYTARGYGSNPTTYNPTYLGVVGSGTGVYAVTYGSGTGITGTNNNTGGGNAHNNIDPAEADAWIVRIA